MSAFASRLNAMALLMVLLVSHAICLGRDVVLEDDEMVARFDANSGALTRLQSKSLGWVIERRRALGASFRLLVPLPGRRDNFVLGQKQRAAAVEKISAHEIAIRWNNPVSEHGGVLPLTLTARVSLTNGTLTFAATLDNESPLVVETVDYPGLGDLAPPARATPMQARTMWYGNLESREIYPAFGNEKGYWGVNFPTKALGSHRSLFCLIQAPQEGLYVEMQDSTQPYLLEYTFEQHPGLLTAVGSRVPTADEISGQPVHLEFRTCHFVFAHPHSTVKLVPMVLRCYRGDWHAGVDLYKQWRATWFKPPHIPGWAQDVHAWAMLRLNTPEEDYTIPYTNLAEYGEEYARNGIRAVQVVGWNIGGQDRDDPAQDTEPRLGSRRDFQQAIAQMQAEGVKVILFGKLGWADLTTAWYTNELYRYQATDPYGIRYEQGGYSYVTPTQLAGINNRRRAIMDVLCPAYREVALNQFQKLLGLGAAGWLFDEVCHHGPALYNFAPDHGYSPPGFLYGGDLLLGAQLRAAADKVNPDFLFAGEGQQDWLMQYYAVSETGISGVPICQYIDSRLPLLAGVSGFDDRETLNLILLNHYIIQYEPYYYKGHITEFPLTLAYGQKIDALRRKYKAYLWDGEFRDTLGAKVSTSGSSRYSVFRTSSGKRAVVVVNQEFSKGITATVELLDPGELMTATPEQPQAEPTSGTLQIPARSVAVVIEE
jgi:Domain of unknown function (DUF6259)